MGIKLKTQVLKMKNKFKKPENYDMILLSFKDKKFVKCMGCKKVLKNPMNCEYIFPGCYCKKCANILDKENEKELEKFDYLF